MTLKTAGKWTAAAVALAGGFVMLTGAGPGGHHFSPEKLDKFITFRLNDKLDDVKATDDQRAKILALKDKLLPQFIQAHEDRKAMHEAMVEQWKSATPDAKAVHAAIDAEFDKRRALAHATADALLQAHDILNADQREAFGHAFAHGGFMDGPGMDH